MCTQLLRLFLAWLCYLVNSKHKHIQIKKHLQEGSIYKKNKIGFMYVSNCILNRPSEVHGLVSVFFFWILLWECRKSSFVLSYFIVCFVFILGRGASESYIYSKNTSGLDTLSYVCLVSGSKEICLHFTFSFRLIDLSQTIALLLFVS